MRWENDYGWIVENNLDGSGHGLGESTIAIFL
jgi:hypothetical protein